MEVVVVSSGLVVRFEAERLAELASLLADELERRRTNA
jgi:hypothetical protein